MGYNPDIRPDSIPVDQLRARLRWLEQDQRTGPHSPARARELNRITCYLARPTTSR